MDLDLANELHYFDNGVKAVWVHHPSRVAGGGSVRPPVCACPLICSSICTYAPIRSFSRGRERVHRRGHYTLNRHGGRSSDQQLNGSRWHAAGEGEDWDVGACRGPLSLSFSLSLSFFLFLSLSLPFSFLFLSLFLFLALSLALILSSRVKLVAVSALCWWAGWCPLHQRHGRHV